MHDMMILDVSFDVYTNIQRSVNNTYQIHNMMKNSKLK